MSDDEYYSNNSESEDSDNESIPSTKKTLFKPSANIKTYTTDYADIDDSEPDDAEEEENESDDEIQDGGAEDNPSEDDASEEEDDGDDAELEEGEIQEDDSDIEIDEDGEPIQKVSSQKTAKVSTKAARIITCPILDLSLAINCTPLAITSP